MSMSTGPHDDDEPRRKRVRKGTRSCWECKRRKVRCQLSSEDVPVCSGCLSRGTTCLSQEYPEEREPSGGTQVGERLGRVEALLETLVAKISAYEDEEESQKIMTPESIGNDVLTPFGSNASSASDGTPIITIFDSPVLGRRDQSLPRTPATSSKSMKCGRPNKTERICQALVELLPSQSDVNLIVRSSSSWFIVHAMTTGLMANPAIEPVSVTTTALADVSKLGPTSIARTLMFIAVCLQQLDPELDSSRLHLPCTPEARIEKIIITIQGLVTSDDELVATLHGLECLILMGMFHINAGNVRRAWLAFRRALNIAQLMGCHKVDATMVGAREIWLQITQADRYLALLLGLPAGSADPPFGPDETFDNPNVNTEMLFNRKLTSLSTRIIERNEAAHTHAYATTQDIDEGLDSIAKALPESWWEIPTVVENERTPQAAATFDRIMSQIWFFQLEALLHLPFMLKSERRYDYSKFSCLKASREIMWRYLALRSAQNKSFCCKAVDFGALTASVTLFLGLLEPVSGAETPERAQDRKLIQSVLEATEELSRGGKDIVAAQSASVIRSLLAIDDGSGKNTGNLKLTIPYFGTISIVRPHPTPPSTATSAAGNSMELPYVQPSHQDVQTFQPDQNVDSSQWATSHTFAPQTQMPQTQPNLPLVSFTSSQFPPEQQNQLIQDWGLPAEMDTLFFDSLLNTDIEGNWIF